jgi:hypothetical protein
MATKKKAKAKSSAARKPAKKVVKKPTPRKSPAAERAEDAAAKGPKPLTLKQRLALIRVDPTTGKCPHGLVPDTCSFCMNI